jgi:hypothetical protein
LQTLQESELNKIKDADDALTRYNEGKILGNWLEILENDFLTLDMPYPELKIHRPLKYGKFIGKLGKSV